MSAYDELLAGEGNIRNYDIDNDFDDAELENLLACGKITLRDIGIGRKSDLLIAGVLDYSQCPFDDFPPLEQIRQLENDAISPENFLRQANLAGYECGEWFSLLAILPSLTDRAPWEKMRNEGSVPEWMELLAQRPEFAQFADWKKLAEKGSPNIFFQLFAKQPGLYRKCVNQQELLEADSRLWAELIAKQQVMADIYPLDTLDEVDEVEFLLLHQPQLVDRIHWDKKNPPVKLYISNRNPESMGEMDPSAAWFFTAEIAETLSPILRETLFYTRDDARKQANIIGHNEETFAGIYSKKTADAVIRNFREAVTKADLPLTIRMEKQSNG